MNRKVMLMRLVAFVLAVIWLSESSTLAFGQTTISATGVPTNSAAFPIENGSINLGNGNLHLEIPIANIPQRGDLSLGATLVYDSSIWEVTDASTGYPTYHPAHNGQPAYWSGGLQWTPTNGGGWSLQYGQYFSSTATTNTDACPYSGGSPVYLYSNFQWTDPHGTVHAFPIKTVDLDNCPNSPDVDTPTGQGYAIDGSGYYAKVTAYTDMTIWDPAGTQVVQTQVPSVGGTGAKIVDRNGNFIQYGIDGEVIQDSLGHTPIAQTIASTDANGAPVVVYLDVPIAQSQTARYTITYESIGIKTNFNIPVSNFVPTAPGNVGESIAAIRVVKSLGLPDGSTYLFQYDQSCTPGPCSGSPTTSFGLISGLTLPKGGAVSYGFQSGSNAGTTEPARWASTHSGADGTTNFAYTYQPSYTPTSETGGYNCAKVTNVATSAVLQTTYVFSSCNGTIEPMKVITSPANSPSTVDSLTLYSYDFSNPCQNDACTGAQWIALTGTTTVLASTGSVSGILAGTAGTGLIADTQYTYAAPGSGKISTVKQWDYYNATYPTSLPDSPPGNAMRETDTTYAYSVNNILYPTDVSIKDSTGTIGSEVQYTYDGGSPQPSSTGIPNHSNSLAATSRGNVTATSQIPHGGAISAPTLTAYNTYDDTGAVISVQDPNLNTTTIAYDATDTFPQTVTKPQTYGVSGPISHVTTTVQDFNTGQLLSTTDENQQTISYNYDAKGRPYTVAFSNAGNAVTLSTFTYPTFLETDVSSLQSMDSNGTVLTSASSFVDGYGRPSSSTQSNVSSETQYDSQGHVYSVTNAHLAAPSPTDGTTYYLYDELGRVNSVQPPNAATPATTSNYKLNTVTITDPLSHQRRQTFDAFGNLSSVAEPDAANVLNWITTYQRSDLGQLTEIDQKGGSSNSSDWRKRFFTYDALGRLYTQVTPEAGQYTYSYDNNGNVSKFQNQNTSANTVNYVYDSLNRMIAKQVGGGSTYTYTYDAQDSSGDSYGKGLLTSISDGAATRVRFTHDPLGRIVSQSEQRAGSCSFIYNTQAQYDYQGNLKVLTYPDGRTLEWAYDVFSRPTEEVYTAWNGTPTLVPYLGNVSYYPTGDLQTVTDGSGVVVSANYDPNENLSTLNYSNNGTSLLAATYTFDSNAKNLRQIIDAASGRTQAYTYDQLDRLSSSSDSGTTSSATNTTLPAIPNTGTMSYTIDAWGNLKQSGVWNFTLNAGADNRINSTDYVYDAAGNLKTQTVAGVTNTFTYSADGHQIASNGETYTYDGLDQRVMKSGNTSLQYFYFGGQLLSTLDSTGAWTDVLYGLHGILGTVAGTQNAAPVYRIGDHLDSVAQTTDDNGNVLGGASLLPFGQQTSNSTGTSLIFTGLEQDSENQTTATAFRQYSPAQGRWLSPDPAEESYDFTDPQTFNRYAYVMNQPLTATDPSGLGPCDSWGNWLAFCASKTASNNVNNGSNPLGASWFGPNSSGYSFNLSSNNLTISPSLYNYSASDPQRAARINFLSVAPGGTTSAPNNSVSHCLGKAVAANGVSLALDAVSIGVGFIPGGTAVSGGLKIAKLVGTAGVGVAATAYSAGTSKSFGVGASAFAGGTLGTIISTAAVLDKATGGAGSLLPVLGNISTAISTLSDLAQTAVAYQACRVGG